MENQTIQGSFIKGAAILGIAGIIVKVLGAIFKIPLVSIIASTGMGYYSSAYPIYVMLLAIATSGFPIAISKMVAERRAKGNLKGANEIFYVILTIVSIDFYLHIGTKVFSYLIYSLFIMIYFGILIYDFWKKKITKKDFIIYFIYFFIDIVLVYLSSIMFFLFSGPGSYV